MYKSSYLLTLAEKLNYSRSLTINVVKFQCLFGYVVDYISLSRFRGSILQINLSRKLKRSYTFL